MRYLVLFSSLLSVSVVCGQLSGIVNAYSPVTAFPAPDQLTVVDVSPFAVGDRILIHQAQGAIIDQDNSPTYGDIQDIGGAGLFEFNVIQSISGNTLTLQCPLYNTYGDPANSGIQVVRVSYHTSDQTITGTITAPAWDGLKGGIVAIEVEGVLTFNSNIDVRGKGFRGGPCSANQSNSSCGTLGTPNAYHGPISDTAGQKGEGVAIWPDPNHRACRGKIANGGGGGNIHNTGGGGGGGAGSGGNGGWTTCGCVGNNSSFLPFSGWGYGGVGLSGYNTASTPRAFFGGGGGGGQQNNNESTDGGAGGGIVILRAQKLAGNDYSILAGGAQASRTPAVCSGYPTEAGQDGSGGGGGGGTVILYDMGSYLSKIIVDVSGADGGNTGFRIYPPGCAPCTNDHGPGGGGGGGFLLVSNPTISPQIIPNLAGGNPGNELTPCQQTSSSLNCTNCTNCITNTTDRITRGATAGNSGTILTNIDVTPVSNCPLAYRPKHPNQYHPQVAPPEVYRRSRTLLISISETTPYQLTDALGRVLESGLLLPQDTPYELNTLQNLPAGLYLLQLGEKTTPVFCLP